MTDKSLPQQKFIPARISPLVLFLVQQFSRLDLDRRNRVFISDDDLHCLRSLAAKKNCGLLLIPNHADEMDPRVCFELSRRAGSNFVYMCNREAFDELSGVAGWLLQRIGAFSVERGGHDVLAKQFAVDTLKQSKDTLVIFPEGEIFYLNQAVQPFHSGAIEIGMQAIIEKSQSDPDWTVYLLPMSIKYRYVEPLHSVFEKRIARMEQVLKMDMIGDSIHTRLLGILEELLRQKEDEFGGASSAECVELASRLEQVRRYLVRNVGKKYSDAYSAQARTIDQAFQLGAHLRKQLAGTESPEHQSEYKKDLSEIEQAKHLVSFNPDYVNADPSQERLAEMLIKLEREVLHVKRPTQLGKREVILRIGKPLDLKEHFNEYCRDPHALRHNLAEQLRNEIQSLIDGDRAQAETLH